MARFTPPAVTTTSAAAAPSTGARDVPWPTGLVAFWDFAETTAPFLSKTGVGPYPLALAGAGAVTKGEAGPFGASLSFTGATGASWLELAAAGTGALNVGRVGDTVTVVAWVKRRVTATAAGFVGGMWQEATSDARRQYGLFVDLATYGGNDRVNGHISKTGTVSPNLPFSRDYSSSKRPVTDRWVQIAFTYDGTQSIAYLDALADTYTGYTEPGAPNGESKTYAKNPYLFDLGLYRGNPANFTVGACLLTSGMANWYDGLIGGLAVFNRALTQAELMRLNAAVNVGNLVTFDMARETSIATGNQLLDVIGWSALKSATAATPAAGAGFTSVQLTGGPGFLSLSSSGSFTDNATVPNFAWYDTFGGLRFSQLGRVTVDLNNSSSTVPCRLAVRMNGQWYVSETSLTMTGAGVSGSDWSSAETKTLTPSRAAAGWRKLTVTPGTSLTLAASVESTDLPNLEVTGVGVFTPGVGTSANLRLRNLAIFSA